MRSRTLKHRGSVERTDNCFLLPHQKQTASQLVDVISTEICQKWCAKEIRKNWFRLHKHWANFSLNGYHGQRSRGESRTFPLPTCAVAAAACPCRYRVHNYQLVHSQHSRWWSRPTMVRVKNLKKRTHWINDKWFWPFGKSANNIPTTRPIVCQTDLHRHEQTLANAPAITFCHQIVCVIGWSPAILCRFKTQQVVGKEKAKSRLIWSRTSLKTWFRTTGPTGLLFYFQAGRTPKRKKSQTVANPGLYGSKLVWRKRFWDAQFWSVAVVVAAWSRLAQ